MLLAIRLVYDDPWTYATLVTAARLSLLRLFLWRLGLRFLLRWLGLLLLFGRLRLGLLFRWLGLLRRALLLRL
jgi:hypothetical protein